MSVEPYSAEELAELRTTWRDIRRDRFFATIEARDAEIETWKTAYETVNTNMIDLGERWERKVGARDEALREALSIAEDTRPSPLHRLAAVHAVLTRVLASSEREQ